MDGQEPAKPTIEIIQRFDESVRQLCTDIDTSKIIALQMMTDKTEDMLPMIQGVLAKQQKLEGMLPELIARVAHLEQHIQEQEKQKHEHKLQKHSQPIFSDQEKSQPSQVMHEIDRKNCKKTVNRYQSTISFKLVATSLVTTLISLLWIYTHQK
jgi:hypothetical protein